MTGNSKSYMLGKNGSCDITPEILVADDDRMERFKMKRRLEKAGFSVIMAEDGTDALEKITDNVGVVLLDMHMPKMDGITCLREICRRFEDISPIMVTANDDIANAVQAMKYGAADYLLKPVDGEYLLALVRKMSENWQRACQLRHVKVELEKAQNREMDIAGKIQQTLLMGRPPRNIQGIEVDQLSIPSQTVDGDFFDFFRLDKDFLDIMVGDVMGKGVASALLGAALKSHIIRVINDLLLTSQCAGLPEPEDIVAGLHQRMIDQLEAIESFATLCYARIDLKKSEIRFVDCGHVRTLHYHKSDGSVSLLEGVNVPLGLPEFSKFEQSAVPFEPGDFFFFYSDGLTETESPAGELYGEKRLVEFIRKNGNTPPQMLIGKTRREMLEFSKSESFDDDFTCVVAAIKDKE